jgi:iron complex outermembrane receptor protein
MLVYSNQYFQLSANGVYKIRTEQNASAINATISPNYFLLNARCEVFVVKKIAGCFIEASNLFDTNYSDLLGAQMPGRWIMAGINLNF